MKAWQAILGGGLTAGAVDILAAMTMAQVGPLPVLRFISAGIIGMPAAHGGGLAAAALGAVCHFSISLIFAAFYVLVSRRLPILARQPLIFGPLYGVGVYVVMNYIVVPLSNVHGKGAPTEPLSIAENMLAMIVFGLIIALFASRAPVSAPSSPPLAADTAAA